MWKYASRSIKSIFCKSQKSHNNILARATRNDNRTHSIINLSPSVNNFYRHYGETRDHSQFSQNDKKENPKTGKGNCLHDLQSEIFGALQWSGIFFIGWYLLQPFAHRKAISSPYPSGKCPFNVFTEYTHNECSKLLNYLKNSAKPLHYAIPIVQAQNSSKTDNSDDSQEEELIGKALESAHLRVLAVFSNFRGAHCLESGKYSEALSHFQDAARVLNPAALFNLGLCHELGLGTVRNMSKAAELYRQASDLGHPTATYNLGVFYINGWGNVKSDMNEARKFFRKAASLGHPDAKLALGLKEDDSINNSENDEFEKTGNYAPEHTEEKSKQRKTFNFNLVKELTSKLINYDDSGALDLSPEENVTTIT